MLSGEIHKKLEKKKSGESPKQRCDFSRDRTSLAWSPGEFRSMNGPTELSHLDEKGQVTYCSVSQSVAVGFPWTKYINLQTLPGKMAPLS